MAQTPTELYRQQTRRAITVLDTALKTEANRPIQFRPDNKHANTWMMLGGRVVKANPFLRSSGIDSQFMSALQSMSSDYGMSDEALARAFTVGITAYVCTLKRARLVASLPLRVLVNGTPVLDMESPAHEFVKLAPRTMGQVETSLSIWGKNYFYKRRNMANFPVKLDWLNPLEIQPRVDLHTGDILAYLLTDHYQEIPKDDVIYSHNFNTHDPNDAVSPYEVAMKSISTEGNIRQFAASFFLNGARPDALLYYKGDELDEDDLREYGEQFKKNFKGTSNSFRTGILPGGSGDWEYFQISAKPDDLAMAELTQVIREDVIAVFELNPVIVGLGDAGDPMSAVSTYRAAWEQHVEFFAIPEAKTVLDDLNDQWLNEYEPIYGPMTIEVDHQKVNSSSRATAERGQFAIATTGSNLLTANEGRNYLGLPEDASVLQRTTKDASIAYQDGAIRKNEYRRHLGLTPDPDGDKYIYDIDPRYQGPPPFSFSFPGASGLPPISPPAPAALPQLARRTASPSHQISNILSKRLAVVRSQYTSRDTGEKQTGVMLAFFPSSDDAARIVDALPSSSRLAWTPSDQLHITLAFIGDIGDPGVDEDQLVAVAGDLANITQDIAVNLNGIGRFVDTHLMDQDAVYLNVDAPGLTEVRQVMVTELKNQGIPVSESHGFTPHMTICYIPKDAPMPDIQWQPLEIELDTLTLAWGNQRHDFELRMRTIEAVATRKKQRFEELRKWRQKQRSHTNRCIRSGDTVDAVPFEAEHLPEGIQRAIRTGLDNGWDYRHVFDVVEIYLRADQVPEDEPFGITSEEFEAYWRELNELNLDLQQEWLDYMQAVSAQVFASVEQLDDEFDYDAVFDQHINTLASAWVGTVEEPGTLQKIILGGFAKGNEVLNNLDLPDETRSKLAVRSKGVTRDGPSAKFTLDWETFNQEAYDFSTEYAYDLIRQINDTTRQQIGAVVAQSIEGNWSSEQLAKELEPILVKNTNTPPERVQARARLISVSEMARAFNAGAERRWQVAGFTRAIWQTVRDMVVCRACRRLHGQSYEIQKGIYSDVLGKIVHRIAHPGCRCFQKPDETSLDIDAMLAMV